MRRTGSGMPTSPSSSSARLKAWALGRPMWRMSGSASCAPTVNTGLSEDIGSWKTQAISLPRRPWSSLIEALSRSRPCHSTWP